MGVINRAYTLATPLSVRQHNYSIAVSTYLEVLNKPCSRSVIDTKESDGIADPMEKIAIKSHTDHSDSGIGKMLILIDTYFVIILLCNEMTK